MKDLITKMAKKYGRYYIFYVLLKWGMLSAIFLYSGNLFSQDATDIIRKMDEKMQGNSNRVEMTMTIVRPKWTREMSMKSWSEGTENSLILVTGPARDKGTAFLKRNEEMWNWQPTIDRVVKLPPSMMMQSWMGSDFTNDDLVKQSSIVNDYVHTLEKDTVIQGYDCFKIKMVPKEEAAVVWGKVVQYVSKQDYLQMLVKFYDEDDFLINTMLMSEIKEMGGRTIPTKMEVIPAENPDQKTMIVYKDIEFDIKIPENFFSMQNMKKIR